MFTWPFAWMQHSASRSQSRGFEGKQRTAFMKWAKAGSGWFAFKRTNPKFIDSWALAILECVSAAK